MHNTRNTSCSGNAQGEAMKAKEIERRVKYVMRTKKVSYTCAAYWVRRYAEGR